MNYLSSLLLLVSASVMSESKLNKPIDVVSVMNSKSVSGKIIFKGRIMQEPCTLNVRNYSVKTQQKSNGCVEYTKEKIEIMNERTVEKASIIIVSYI
ncbi:hypothetical protein [Vibrio nomapromontoriensis]|uniref:hypothetical protein n=1 Tax=Vibrio nomapromontoriensis TaxID=2910246 RepID=UPI003D125EC8